jgi:hypothetical protein
MSVRKLSSFAAALLLGAFLGIQPVAAQSTGDPQAAEKARAAEAAKDAKKVDELNETSKAISGPAGNPECIWLGRRAVNLLWRDDLDTAFRHLDLYDRFGCPGGHVQATFRCVVRQGPIDPKSTDGLNSRIQACWINPSAPPAGNAPAAASTNPPSAAGTTAQ